MLSELTLSRQPENTLAAVVELLEATRYEEKGEGQDRAAICIQCLSLAAARKQQLTEL